MGAQPYSIGICGSYGGMNLGDESILTVISAELRRRVPASITVLSRDPFHTMAHHPLERAVAVRQLSRAQLLEEIRQLDLLILGGGGILFDSEATEFVRPALVAHELGVPVVTWAIGVGPLQSQIDQVSVRGALEHAQLITVRDFPSQLLLEQLGVTRDIFVTADPAHLLEPEPFTDSMLEADGIRPSEDLIGVSVRGSGPAAPDVDRRAHELLACAVDYLVERFDVTPVFIPMERSDLREAHLVASFLSQPGRARFLSWQYSAQQICGLAQRVIFGVGLRLHFLLLSAGAGVPSVVLRYGSKIGALADELGMPALSIGDTTPGQLIASVDRMFRERRERRKQVLELSRELATRAAWTGDRVVELLEARRRSPGAAIGGVTGAGLTQ